MKRKVVVRTATFDIQPTKFEKMKALIDRIKTFMSEVKQELAKCSMPTWGELKGSTMVIIVSMLVLGLFSFVVDLGFHYLIHWMIQ